MRFINLDKLKIIKEHTFTQQEASVFLPFKDGDITLSTIKEQVYAAISNFFVTTAMPVNYVINLYDHETSFHLTDEEKGELFESIVNVALAVFFNNFILNKGRKRERRLDVPERLKQGARVNFSLLKKAVNSATYSDIFHLSIVWGDLHYDLVNQEYEESTNVIEKDFVHDVDELDATMMPNVFDETVVPSLGEGKKKYV